MRTVFFITFLLVVVDRVAAQSSITGMWASEDGKREYNIYQLADGSFEGRLMYTIRSNETAGAYVLKYVTNHSGKGKYRGLIYSISDSNLMASVKIRYKRGGNTLHLVIPRMLFFNIRLRWYRLAG